MYRLGIDGGGSTTRAVVVDEAMQIVGYGEAGASNWYGTGLEVARRNVAAAVQAALAAAGQPPANLASWGVGLAGACTAQEQQLWQQQLQPLAGDVPVVVDEDAAAAQRGAFGGGPGVVCIAGTGANSFGINARGQRARADGLGPLLGDRGSGYWIGEQALRAACIAYDGAAPATSLLDAILYQYEIDSVDELVRLVYGPKFERDRVAGLFPVVVRCADDGDAVAHNLLSNAGHELALSAWGVLQRLGLKNVALTGGVIARDTPVQRSCIAALEARVPGAVIGPPLYDAAVGAALLVGAA